MKTILMSIQSYYFYLIIMGLKKIEVRKFDFKGIIYLYCSQNKKSFNRIPEKDREMIRQYLGKVGARFEVKETTIIIKNGFVNPFAINNEILQKTRISNELLIKYSDGYKKDIYALHITDLKIYDKPKELKEFYIPCHGLYSLYCAKCKYYKCQSIHDLCFYECSCDEKKPITAPPQNYVYVEVI